MDAKILQATDIVGGTFYLLSVSMIAASALFLLGTFWVAGRWKVSVALTGLVTIVAAAFYLYAQQIWVVSGQAAAIFRYVEWMITVPIQVVTLYFFIAAIAVVPVGVFWRLAVVSVLMMIARFLGDAEYINITLGFLLGIVGWLYILGKIYFSRLSEICAKSGNEPVQLAYFWLRLIVTVGWAIYPLVGFIANFAGGIDEASLNVVYNLFDYVNKIAFGVAILTAATRDSRLAK